MESFCDDVDKCHAYRKTRIALTNDEQLTFYEKIQRHELRYI